MEARIQAIISWCNRSMSFISKCHYSFYPSICTEIRSNSHTIPSNDTIIFNTITFPPIRLFIFGLVIFLAVYGIQYSYFIHSISHRHSIQSDLRFPFDLLDTKKKNERDSNRNIAMDFPTNFDEWKPIHGNSAEFSDIFSSLVFFSVSVFVLLLIDSIAPLFSHWKKTKNDWLNCENLPNDGYNRLYTMQTNRNGMNRFNLQNCCQYRKRQKKII